ncbi:MAG: DUF4290 domain-containing protein [Muribaculaceae bacterium]|nr:DUF4290 domain-containing protein [Muribaculaceae bacterium]
MLDYNTQNRQLALPEYGRNIQQMVDFCLTIEDREIRTNCAFAIIDVMKNIMPDYEKQDDGIKMLWDHLNIMADFKLDIDFPFEVIKPEEMNPMPQRIPYGNSAIRYRHYGKNIEQMIDRVANMEDSSEKDMLVSMIAHHMKKLMLIHNKEGVADAKILRDLAEYSHGKINLNPETYLLHEFHEAQAPEAPKKSKKKKK